MEKMRTIHPGKKTKIQSDLSQSYALAKIENKNSHIYDSLSDEIAESKDYTRYFKIRELEQEFPHEPYLRSVGKHYPHAKNGTLLVDEVNDDIRKAECMRKHEALKRLGYRHVVLEPDTTKYEAYTQLGEI